LNWAVLPAASQQPNFILFWGKGQGWSSTSVRMDDALPASKNAFVRTPNLEMLAGGCASRTAMRRRE
jgi:hypothetical protein